MGGGGGVVIAVVAAVVTTLLLLQEKDDTPLYDDYEMTIPQGPILGRKYLTNGAYEFYNLPYAQPPINEKRFAAPVFGQENIPKWDELRDSQHHGKRCLVKSGEESNIEDMYSFNEDCLNLIVATKNPKPIELKPVLVYIHGGLFQTGSADQLPHDLSILASELDIVVVMMNYRLGVLGFGGFEGEFLGQKTVGNFGLMDQYAALQWIQDNIEFFGGDKNSVTLWGESAGAESCTTHLLWPESSNGNNLKGCIPMSHPLGVPYQPKHSSQKLFERLAENFNCVKYKRVDISCLRRIEGQALIDDFVLPVVILDEDREVNLDYLLAAAQLWPPTVDDYIVKGQPMDELAKEENKANMKPLFGGVAEGEGDPIVKAILRSPSGAAPYNLVIDVVFRKYAADIKQMYPYQPEIQPDSRDVMVQIVTDFVFRCPYRKVFATNKNTTFMYNWARPSGIPRPKYSEGPETYDNCGNVACHSDTGLWSFGDYKMVDYLQKHTGVQDSRWADRYKTDVVIQQTDLDIGLRLRENMKNFLEFSNPGTDWPFYSEEGNYAMRMLSLEGEWSDGFDYRKEYCDFWDELDIYGKM